MSEAAAALGDLPTDVQVAAIVGFLLPALVSVVIRSDWPGWVKGLVVILSSVGAGLLTAWAQGDLGDKWTQNVIIITMTAINAYKFFWQPTGISPAIERATQPSATKKPPSEK